MSKVQVWWMYDNHSFEKIHTASLGEMVAQVHSCWNSDRCGTLFARPLPDGPELHEHINGDGYRVDEEELFIKDVTDTLKKWLDMTTEKKTKLDVAAIRRCGEVAEIKSQIESRIHRIIQAGFRDYRNGARYTNLNDRIVSAREALDEIDELFAELCLLEADNK